MCNMDIYIYINTSPYKNTRTIHIYIYIYICSRYSWFEINCITSSVGKLPASHLLYHMGFSTLRVLHKFWISKNLRPKRNDHWTALYPRKTWYFHGEGLTWFNFINSNQQKCDLRHLSMDRTHSFEPTIRLGSERNWHRFQQIHVEFNLSADVGMCSTTMP